MASVPGNEHHATPLLTLPFELRHRILSELFDPYSFRLHLDNPALAKRKITWHRCLEYRITTTSSSKFVLQPHANSTFISQADYEPGDGPTPFLAVLESCNLLHHEASLLVASKTECLLKSTDNAISTPQMVWETFYDWRTYVPSIIKSYAPSLRIAEDIQAGLDPLKLSRIAKIEQFLPHLSSLRSITWFSGDMFVPGMIWRGNPPHLVGRMALRMASKRGKKPEGPGPWGYVGVEHGNLNRLFAQLEQHETAKMLTNHATERHLKLIIEVALTWAFGPRLTPPIKPGYALSIDMMTKEAHLFYLENYSGYESS